DRALHRPVGVSDHQGGERLDVRAEDHAPDRGDERCRDRHPAIGRPAAFHRSGWPRQVARPQTRRITSPNTAIVAGPPVRFRSQGWWRGDLETATWRTIAIAALAGWSADRFG